MFAACVAASRCRALALAFVVAGAPLEASAGRSGGAAVVARPHESRGKRERTPHEPHDAYRMNAARRTWARARGRLTDVQAAALVAEGKLSHREAFLLVRSGVEARRVARAIAQEPGEVGVAFSARAGKLRRYGLSRREARILARSGAQVIRVRDVRDSLVFRFLAGTDPAWAAPADDPGGPVDVDDEPSRAARLRASLSYLGVDEGRSDPDLLDAARRAYRAIAKKTHPDRINARTDLTAPEKAAAIRRFQLAAEHFETVEDIIQPPTR
jgi:hypothetical protein